MYSDYQELLISDFMKKSKTKKDVWDGLVKLDKVDINHLDEIYSNLLLNCRIFRLLLNSPNDEEKVLLQKIWDFKNGDLQYILSYDAVKTSFGRILLKTKNSNVEFFELLVNKGTLKELKEFLIQQPEIFKQSQNYKLTIFSLKKMLLCESDGMKFNFKELSYTIEQDELKDPAKLFNFISRHKKGLSETDWDKLMTSLLYKVDRFNYTSVQKIGDIFTIIDKMNKPGAINVAIFRSDNIYAQGAIFFDESNKLLNKEQLEEKWINSIKKLNIDKIVVSSFWDKANSFLTNENIIFSIKKNYKDLLLNRYEIEPDEKSSRWPLFSFRSYRFLLDREEFREVILGLIVKNFKLKINKSFYEKIKGLENTYQRHEVYMMYEKNIIKYPLSSIFISSILGQDFKSQEYQRVKSFVRVQMNTPEKPSSHIRIKI